MKSATPALPGRHLRPIPAPTTACGRLMWDGRAAMEDGGAMSLGRTVMRRLRRAHCFALTVLAEVERSHGDGASKPIPPSSMPARLVHVEIIANADFAIRTTHASRFSTQFLSPDRCFIVADMTPSCIARAAAGARKHIPVKHASAVIFLVRYRARADQIWTESMALPAILLDPTNPHRPSIAIIHQSKTSATITPSCRFPSKPHWLVLCAYDRNLRRGYDA
ncbi:hypothetical protein DFH06DRAFT_1348824 [Mycena polygramma]|nr:hypothetical protein DFH06DRAFT_1348824 [Mycena polygramma]